MKGVWSFLVCLLTISLRSAIQDVPSKDMQCARTIKRLEWHVSFLLQFHKKNNVTLAKMLKDAKKAFWELDITEYQHELNRLCIKKMMQVNRIDPVFETWRLFVTMYRDIDISLFIHEFSVIIFCVYKNLVFSLLKPDHKVTSNDIFELSVKIMSLPIDQVLDALDLCYRQFILIMQDYGMTAPISWKEWVRQYWWVLPVSVVSLIISIARDNLLRPFIRREDQPVSIDKMPDKQAYSCLLYTSPSPRD